MHVPDVASIANVVSHRLYPAKSSVASVACAQMQGLVSAALVGLLGTLVSVESDEESEDLQASVMAGVYPYIHTMLFSHTCATRQLHLKSSLSAEPDKLSVLIYVQ